MVIKDEGGQMGQRCLYHSQEEKSEVHVNIIALISSLRKFYLGQSDHKWTALNTRRIYLNHLQRWSEAHVTTYHLQHKP